VQRYFGAWAPQEINYQDSVNTLAPWLAGAAIGLLASTNEEFTFRLFAIPFFQRLTGSRCDRGDLAGIHVELSAQQLSARGRRIFAGSNRAIRNRAGLVMLRGASWRR